MSLNIFIKYNFGLFRQHTESYNDRVYNILKTFFKYWLSNIEIYYLII